MAAENRTVIGSYSNRDDLRDVVDRLVSEGYTKDEITLYANSDTVSTLQDTQGVDIETTGSERTGDMDHESMWDKIKDAFSVGTRDEADYDDVEYDSSEDILLPFRGDLNSGNVVVVVENYRGMERGKAEQADVSGVHVNGYDDASGQLDTNARTAPMAGISGVEDEENVRHRANMDLNNNTGIRHDMDDEHDKHFEMGNKSVPTDRKDDYSDEYLETQNAAGYKGTKMDRSDFDRTDDVVGRDVNDTMDDRDLTKHDLDEDEKIRLKEERLNVDKKDVQTGEVDIHKRTVHETKTVDVPVEREEVVIDRKPVRDGETVSDDFDNDEIHIPIREEQVEVTKKPVVTEEVEIRKEKRTDTKHVSEDVRREELDVDTEGEVDVEDGNDTYRP